MHHNAYPSKWDSNDFVQKSQMFMNIIIWYCRCICWNKGKSNKKYVLLPFGEKSYILPTQIATNWKNSIWHLKGPFKYRHSSYNAVLLYRGIPSNAVFSKPKTVLNFYLTWFFQNDKKKKLQNICKKKIGG